MKSSLGAKLFFTAFGLMAASALSADVYFTHQTEVYVTHLVEDDLAVRARQVARMAASRGDGDWALFVERESKALGARVTLVRPDGSSVDSDPELAKRETARPEITDALAGRTGVAHARVGTERVAFVAVPADAPFAAVRVATPLSAPEEASMRVRKTIWATGALALALAAVLSFLVARRVSRAVGDVTSAAQRMREGDLDVRTHLRGDDELSELGGALDALASDLSETIGQLRAERDLQLRILEGMREGVLVLDDEDRIVMLNPALRDMLLLGYDPKPASLRGGGGDYRGRLFLEIARHAELQELLEKTRQDGNAAAEIDIEGIKPRKLLVHASTLEGEGGGLLAVCVDVTDVRRLESLRRDFVANVSHELRTPVAAMRSATETLQGGAVHDAKAAPRFLDIIDRNAQRLQALIEDLLELSKLDAKQYRLNLERVEVEPALQITLSLFRERAEKKGVRLGANVPKDVPALETDRRALEQIVGNLVDNAIKYCPPGASVAVKVQKRSNNKVRLAVEDTGPGIEERHLARLFERFYRVDAGRSREVGGTGLGLSIVKHLAEALGGEVGVESAVGKGSTFWLDLPLRNARTSRPQLDAEA